MEILMEEKSKMRAKKMDKFIMVAQKLFELNNFETLMCILGALSDVPIYRVREFEFIFLLCDNFFKKKNKKIYS
jgi:hypothetical protein